ncbi:MFS transporter [Streptomyces sp. 8K308]|uniref:MFS transporter n=1 Tax=Streptomyces sp. 8K308 TaxID=2530388 RepID=UPI001FB64905|nr:MFS transporter [Streptomyces sp. 8K308]
MRSAMWPLYAAGFTTAFGAHGIAANLGQGEEDLATSLLYLGLLLALYDGAEVVLKPVFGTLADRVGARPVLIGGLLGFAAASALFVVVRDPGWLWAARLGRARRPRPSRRRLRRWSPASTRRSGTGARSAPTASTSPSATRRGR